MKVLLALGVVLAVSVALSSAYCYLGKSTFDWKTKTTECEHRETIHKMGESWIADCEDCSCGKKYMQCCSLKHTPQFNKEECESTFHEESCSYTVTRKDNPSEECEIIEMIG
ncbi:beta-microseminoprotein-like [Anomaloglossus baeobatrachus]|uniref:beta-microseminoprotein-like n=1 Tax=Anomaloglossus baeobatrachus TaxID=238106 RepID=UPI003F4FDB09